METTNDHFPKQAEAAHMFSGTSKNIHDEDFSIQTDPHPHSTHLKTNHVADKAASVTKSKIDEPKKGKTPQKPSASTTTNSSAVKKTPGKKEEETSQTESSATKTSNSKPHGNTTFAYPDDWMTHKAWRTGKGLDPKIVEWENIDFYAFEIAQHYVSIERAKFDGGSGHSSDEGDFQKAVVSKLDHIISMHLTSVEEETIAWMCRMKFIENGTKVLSITDPTARKIIANKTLLADFKKLLLVHANDEAIIGFLRKIPR